MHISGSNYKKLQAYGDSWQYIQIVRLARRMESEGIKPPESSIKRLIAGGESFSEEARIIFKKFGMCRFITPMEAPKAQCVENA